jgi:maltokinase
MNPEDLSRWLPEQRWFAGRDRRISEIRSTRIATLLEDPLTEIHAVTVDYTDGGSDLYQVPVVQHDHPVPELGAALIGGGDSDSAPCFVYDAPHDPAAAAALWRGIVTSQHSPGLDFHGEA